MDLDQGEITMELINKLKTLQADIVTAYFQVHGYHWNVEGVLFPEMHSKFLEVYEDVYDSIDDISEMLRKLNTKAPFQLGDFVVNRSIGEVYSGTSAKDQIESFLNSNDIVIKDIELAHESADQAGEIGIASDLEIRHSMHKKWKWQLSSILKSQVM